MLFDIKEMKRLMTTAKRFALKLRWSWLSMSQPFKTSSFDLLKILFAQIVDLFFNMFNRFTTLWSLVVPEALSDLRDLPAALRCQRRCPVDRRDWQQEAWHLWGPSTIGAFWFWLRRLCGGARGSRCSIWCLWSLDQLQDCGVKWIVCAGSWQAATPAHSIAGYLWQGFLLLYTLNFLICWLLFSKTVFLFLELVDFKIL